MHVSFYCADQNPQRDRSLGITSYTIGLLNALRKRDDMSLSAIVSRSSFAVPAGIQRYTIPFRTDRTLGRLVADHLHPLIAPNGADVWHYPKGFLPIGTQVRAKKAGTIADAILQYYADHYPGSRSRLAFAYWLRMLKHSIENFDLIFTVSEFSKHAIQEFCARYSIKSPEIVVTYEGSMMVPSNNSIKKEGYILHLTSVQPHKRTKWFLETWFKLRQSRTDLPRLRIVGSIPSDVDRSFLQDVEVRPSLADDEYRRTLAGALALVLPSEIEGFGLPALEAYFLQTPVAFVRQTAVEEILGPNTVGGFVFDRDSLWSALEALLRLPADVIGAKSAELQKRFSWNKVADRVVQGYASIT